MDLENFDNEGLQGDVPEIHQRLSPGTVLRILDDVWFAQAGRKARWMDLLGDFAGKEPFIIDGEALFYDILADSLVAIGHENDPSFQILHAYHSLERKLNEFVQRSANFEIVFWEVNRHYSLHTGSSSFRVSSRALARRLIFQHLSKLPIPVHVFDDLSDQRWIDHQQRTKPMFVMTNDGGALSADESHATALRILSQRMFFFELLSKGIAVASLNGAEFQDTRVLSFIYEQRHDRTAKSILPLSFWGEVSRHCQSLNGDQARGFFRLYQASASSTVGSDQFPLKSRVAAFCAEVLRRSPLGFPAELLYLFIVHALLLPTLSVFERALPRPCLDSHLTSILIRGFLPEIFSVGAMFPGEMFDTDGRVFATTLSFLSDHHAVPITELIDSSVMIMAEDIWAGGAGPGLDIPGFLSQFQHGTIETELRTADAYRLLPFSNPILDAELSMVHFAVEDHGNTPAQVLGRFEFGGTISSDTRHWHNARKSILPPHMGGDPPQRMDERQRRRHERSNQRFMKTMQIHAATLTGASGAALEPITIAPVGSSSKITRPRSSRPVQHSSSSKQKAPKQKAADRIRQNNLAAKADKDTLVSQLWWKTQLKFMDAMSPSDRLLHIDGLSRNRRTSESEYLALEFRLYQIDAYIRSWIEKETSRSSSFDPHGSIASESASLRDKYSLQILRIVKQCSEAQPMTRSARKLMDSIVQALGFQVLFPQKFESSLNAEDRPLSFKFIKLISSRTGNLYDFMRVTEHPVEWQLRLFGQFMDRSMDSAPDTRVAFDPDQWQREVLDAVDRRSSLLVVAPTSAGKTFISFYAMERVLRETDDGVVIYVAPTKALVSQIASEIYARFSKKLANGSFWAVHTRDYRVHDVLRCQILVTVPEMLAILLLSPALARDWIPRIKWVILDEIHSIGQQEGGLVWEQIILMAPCPIIGLSATIGTPEIFNNWLESVQQAHGFEHRFIHHPHRYSHLRKFFYLIEPENNVFGKNCLNSSSESGFAGLLSHKFTERLRFLHPIAMASVGGQTLPSDLSLEASDTLTLYRAFLQNTHKLDDLPTLDPTVFFASNIGFLRQKDILRYEASLKGYLSRLITHFGIDSLREIILELEDDRLSLDSEMASVAPSRQLFLLNLLPMVADLHVSDQLPAILFNLDRTGCEIMAKELLKTLQAAEAKWKEKDGGWKKKIRQWNLWLSKEKERKRAEERDQARTRKKDPDAQMDISPASWETTFDPDDPLEQFSFAGNHLYPKVDLRKDVDDLRRWSSTPEWALQALYRGIAVHHAGMNKRYRSLVEGLFRRGYLRVIIATGTLALGINAPAKTSVFCGDSPFLTSLMYRQCAGRAGRRGYDLLGRVIFYGISFERVQRIVLSKLPSLQGNFPLTSTLTLRLLSLLEGSDRSAYAAKCIQNILSLPQISFGSDFGHHQLLHHLRFSIEYLRRARLVDEAGKPVNLFTLAGRLYYTEPSNFALLFLLRSGVLHDISKTSDAVSARRQFIVLMSHLFGRRYLTRAYADPKNISRIVCKYPSSVILEPLPAKVRRLLLAHEEETLRIYTGYATAYTTEYATALGPDTRLPLSKMDMKGNDATSPSEFQSYLQQISNKVTVRSAFVATSGHTDADFHSTEELTRTARQGLHLNGHAVPSFSRFLDNSPEHPLNAYILDFYTHGQVTSLAIANGIRRGDVWYLLQEFSLTLATMKSALEELLLKKEEAVDGKDDPVDPAERDTEEESEEGSDSEEREERRGSGVTRPPQVSIEDWRLYEMVQEAAAEFDAKFKAMWA